MYYYWVRSTTALPENSVVPRKTTTTSIANLILNARQQIKYYGITDKDKLILGNSSGLNDDHIKLIKNI